MNSDTCKNNGSSVALVGLENCSTTFDRLFSYAIPDGVTLVPGMRVLVPFGSGQRKRQGFVFNLCDSDSIKENIKLKEIYDVLDSEPILSDELLKLAEWLRSRTFCTYFDAAKAMLPGGMCLRTEKTYKLIAKELDIDGLSANQRQVIAYLKSKNESVRESVLLSKTGIKDDTASITKLVEKGYIEEDRDTFARASDYSFAQIRLAQDVIIEEALDAASPKQRAVLSALADTSAATIKELCYFTGVSAGVINTLINKGIAEKFTVTLNRTPFLSQDEGFRKEIKLSPEQTKAYDGLRQLLLSRSGAASLLFGVTGSGKTSVYMKLIDDVLDDGKNVIVMVPEISLTPQTIGLFNMRYGKNIAVFHSGLSVGERRDEWKRVKNGEAKIVIGTRSAVFAPMTNIGLIVIDEEQEHTYKSEMTPRYHARDVAKFRCAYNKALLLLCSATPSIETYANALSGNYTLFELPCRYGKAELPEVKIIDMSVKENKSGYSSISRELFKEIDSNLQNKEQTILLLNRRGYNTFVACSSCKKVLMCPNCSISLTYHSANNRLMCHYCGYSSQFTEKCPVCAERNVRYAGCGTQKLEEELKFAFPDADIIRMDADTTVAKNSHETTLAAFAEGKYDILIGTQMVAKGLDFPRVTLVGVLAIDQQLYSDDYRSSERAFDLITQVVGRSGRGDKSGRAVIQTEIPDNSIISLAAAQNYKEFFSIENDMRKAMIYPPYCDLCHIGFSAVSEQAVYSAASRFLNDLKKLNDEEKYREIKMIAYGPLQPRVEKISSQHRMKIIIKTKNSSAFREFLSELIKIFKDIKEFRTVSVFADINSETDF